MKSGELELSKYDLNPNSNSVVLRLLNQVKHTARSFADRYNLDFENFVRFLNCEENDMKPIIDALISHPGIDVRVLLKSEVAENVNKRFDRNPNVAFMSAEETKKSARIFSRGPESGKKDPFYRYFDTAVRSTSPFRPELIEQLYVADGEPNLEDYYFNNGHFEDQLTLYLGDVNLHWTEADRGQATFKATRFSTSYKLPFIPHTFTSRTYKTGRILAVTYLGPISNPHFLELVGTTQLSQLCNLLESYEELQETSQLSVLTSGSEQKQEISSEKFHSIPLLNKVPDQPNSSINLLHIPRESESVLNSKSTHQWLFNCSDVELRVEWLQLSFRMTPDSSLAIAPETQFKIINLSATDAKLVCFSSKPGEGDPMLQAKRILKSVGPAAISRIQNETCQWFN
jgi:hypothetical protein